MFDPRAGFTRQDLELALTTRYFNYRAALVPQSMVVYHHPSASIVPSDVAYFAAQSGDDACTANQVFLRHKWGVVAGQHCRGFVDKTLRRVRWTLPPPRPVPAHENRELMSAMMTAGGGGVSGGEGRVQGKEEGEGEGGSDNNEGGYQGVGDTLKVGLAAESAEEGEEEVEESTEGEEGKEGESGEDESDNGKGDGAGDEGNNQESSSPEDESSSSGGRVLDGGGNATSAGATSAGGDAALLAYESRFFLPRSQPEHAQLLLSFFSLLGFNRFQVRLINEDRASHEAFSCCSRYCFLLRVVSLLRVGSLVPLQVLFSTVDRSSTFP